MLERGDVHRLICAGVPGRFAAVGGFTCGANKWIQLALKRRSSNKSSPILAAPS